MKFDKEQLKINSMNIIFDMSGEFKHTINN